MEKRYRYKAADWEGSLKTGFMNAKSNNAANSILKARGLIPLEIKEDNYFALFNAPTVIKLLGKIGFRQYRSKDLMNFCHQLTEMIGAGIPVSRAFTIIAHHMENRAFKKRLASVATEIESGRDIAGALKQQDDFFPPLLINMVASGETGGMLDSTMKLLADHYEKQHDLEEKIRSATAYPLFITITALLVIMVMIIFVLPQFSGIFSAMGLEMPFFSRMMLSAGRLIANHYYLLPLPALLIFFMLFYSLNTKKGKFTADYLRLNFPLFGKIYRYNSAARFSRTLSSLLAGGVTLHEALALTDRTIGNLIISAAISELSDALNNGETIADPMSGKKCFPPLLVEMVRIGEETGSLERSLVRAANYFEKEVSYLAERLGTLLEPVLLLAVGTFIGFLVFSILSPMYHIFEML